MSKPKILTGKKAGGFLLTGIVALALAGCGNSSTPATAGTATVNLKDGTTFSGTVTKSDTSAITLQASTGETRTYPMTQVDSVHYDSPPPGVPATSDNSKMATSTSNAAPPPPPAPAEPPRVIPAGTSVVVRTSDPIDSETASAGQTFPAAVTANVKGEDGTIAIPKGADAMLIVRAAKGQGAMQGQSELVIDLDSVKVNGKRYRMETKDIVEQGKQGVGTNKRSAKFVGGGAALGTIIGAIAGGGKGAAIGAGAGAGAGVATQAATRGKAVRIPAESVLTFRMEAPVEIQPE